jgi:hypothetical protein
MVCDGLILPRDATRLAYWLDELLPNMSEPNKPMLVFKACPKIAQPLAESLQ